MYRIMAFRSFSPTVSNMRERFFAKRRAKGLPTAKWFPLANWPFPSLPVSETELDGGGGPGIGVCFPWPFAPSRTGSNGGRRLFCSAVPFAVFVVTVGPPKKCHFSHISCFCPPKNRTFPDIFAPPFCVQFRPILFTRHAQ